MRMSDIINQGGLVPPWALVGKLDANLQALVNIAKPAYKKAFEARIAELSEVSPAPTRVGIEIECENLHHYMTNFFLNTWRIKSDGSLRNGGVEFISPAIRPEEIPLELAAIYAWIDFLKAKPEFSWRTSIHVHLECINLDVNEFKNLLLLYLLFESSLFQFANPGRRETNIFCTPITRSNFYALEHFMGAQSKADLKAALLDVNGEIKKYSALNLAHLHDFGTVEFRHLRGTGDMQTVITWSKLLLRLFTTACTIDSKELRDQISTLNTTSAYNHFVEDVFGPELAPFLIFPGHAIFLSKSISLVKEILRGNELFKSVKLTEDSGLCSFVTAQRNKEKKDPLAERRDRPKLAVGVSGSEPSTIIVDDIVLEAPTAYPDYVFQTTGIAATPLEQSSQSMEQAIAQLHQQYVSQGTVPLPSFNWMAYPDQIFTPPEEN